MRTNTVIVGGGISGILCALRLSKDKNLEQHEISLIDSHETLGGRFFFSDSGKNIKSGFGFEFQSPNDLDTLKRHLFLYLTEDEKNYLDAFLNEKIQKNPFQTLRPKKYFIKKDLLNADYILLSNSEFLTKKEAELLQKIVNFHQDENYEKEKETLLESFDLWKNCGKNSQENMLGILECVLGQYALKMPMMAVCSKLQNVFYDQATYPDPFFLRTSEIETGLEDILKRRNIDVFTQCTLKSFQKDDEGYELFLTHSKLLCKKIIFTISPYNIRSLVPKEYFSSELARFVAKVQPTSLVCLEIHDFQNKLTESMQNKFNTLDKIYFPIEGVTASITSDGCLHFFLELDYETSLQAPAVRESITHLRRAARRILNSEFSQEIKKGSFIRKTEQFERIILLPIAYNLPAHVQTAQLSELKDIAFNLKDIYAVGDYFYSLGDTTWKRIIKSVEQLLNNFFMC